MILHKIKKNRKKNLWYSQHPHPIEHSFQTEFLPSNTTCEFCGDDNADHWGNDGDDDADGDKRDGVDNNNNADGDNNVSHDNYKKIYEIVLINVIIY